jgi:hypothetical protein
VYVARAFRCTEALTEGKSRSWTAKSGATVDMSATSAPLGSVSTTPFSPNSSVSTTSLVASERNTTSAPAAASAGVSASTAPCFVSSSPLDRVRL